MQMCVDVSTHPRIKKKYHFNICYIATWIAMPLCSDIFESWRWMLSIKKGMQFLLYFTSEALQRYHTLIHVAFRELKWRCWIKIGDCLRQLLKASLNIKWVGLWSWYAVCCLLNKDSHHPIQPCVQGWKSMTGQESN